MANYLERVASSAGRRAAVAKPPTSGPPVLPAGRDFSIAPADPFASDEEQFVEAVETHAPARTEPRAEIASAPKSEISEEATAPQVTTSVAPHEPKPNPRPPLERLSSEPPFTVHVPRTLRPSVAPQVPQDPADRPLREQTKTRESTTVGPVESTIGEEPTPIVHSTESDVSEINQSVTAQANTTELTPQPKPSVAETTRKHQPVHTETTLLPDTTPIPRVDRVDGPPKYSAEPSPPPAMPVHLPPIAANAARQEQSRISIGSLEVLVNNHPRIPTVRPAAAPSRTERLNLEKRYLDRFRLRH